jgi:hypothetical protein
MKYEIPLVLARINYCFLSYTIGACIANGIIALTSLYTGEPMSDLRHIIIVLDTFNLIMYSLMHKWGWARWDD